MNETLVKKIDLGDERYLEIHDTSRKIAADTFWVSMEARLTVEITESLFSSEAADVDAIRKALGERETFEYRGEQNFVGDGEKDATFERLLETFESNTLPYLARPDFPEKFILKRFRESVAGR